MPPATTVMTTAPDKQRTPVRARLPQLEYASNMENGTNVGAIVVWVTVGLLGLALLLVLVWLLRRRRKQQAAWDYAQPGETHTTDDMKPYTITPYIVPLTMSHSSPDAHPPTPPSRADSPEPEFEIATLHYSAASPKSDPGARSGSAVCKADSPEGSAVPWDGSCVTSPTPSLVLEPTSLSSRAGGLVFAATGGFASIKDGLKEKTKKKRKSKIQSVSRSLSFCIDKSRTGNSPQEDVPPLPISAAHAL